MLSLETEQEEDGRWIAEVRDLPGVLAYGATRSEAIARAEALALRVLADRLDHGETVPEVRRVSRWRTAKASRVLAALYAWGGKSSGSRDRIGC